MLIAFKIGVGIDLVPLGKSGRRLVSIINKPSIVAQATYAYDLLNPGKCNNGVSYSINAVDDTTYDLFGLKSGSIYKYTPPNWVSGCQL